MFMKNLFSLSFFLTDCKLNTKKCAIPESLHCIADSSFCLSFLSLSLSPGKVTLVEIKHSLPSITEDLIKFTVWATCDVLPQYTGVAFGWGVKLVNERV